MSRLLLYFRLLFKEWLAMVTGGLIALYLAVQPFTGWNVVPRWIFWCALAVAYTVASYRVTAFLRKAEEGVIGKLIVEAVILLSASKQADGGKVLRAAAQSYKVDTDAIALKVKHEFTAKEKARSAAKFEPKPVPKALKKIA
jgi:hypothetical protein